jgi:hypothetical protein
MGCTLLPRDTSISSVMPAVAVIVNAETTYAAARGPDFHYTQQRPDLDESFALCVTDALSSAQVPLRVVSRTTLNSIAYPGLDPRNTPRSNEAIALLLDNTEFQQRLANAGIRYLAVIGDATQVSRPDAAGFCAVGYGGGGCIGAVWWNHVAGLSVVIFDILARQQTVADAVEARDISLAGLALILPFGKPSFIDALACPKAGAAVAETLIQIRKGRP